MPRPPRSEQFSADEISIVHCIQRCVRRAFLAGFDSETGKDYSHRREWIRRRMEALASVFGIDVLTYAIMSNHFHIILRNRPDVVAEWTDEEVALRWLRVFPGRRLEEHLAEPTENDVQTLARNSERIAEIRTRLSDISWFMRALSEPIARFANRQDECTGRFWEGRFKAQRITDEAGLLACAMYVDLNPVRAAMAETPEESLHTSAYDRVKAAQGVRIASAAYDLVAVKTEDAGKTIRETPIADLKANKKAKRKNPAGKRILRDEWLAPVLMKHSVSPSSPECSDSGVRASDKGFLAMTLHDYVRLLRITASRGHETPIEIPDDLRQLIAGLGIDLSLWRDLVWNFNRYFGNGCCAGSPDSMSNHADMTGRRWARGMRKVGECFAT